MIFYLRKSILESVQILPEYNIYIIYYYFIQIIFGIAPPFFAVLLD